MASGNELFSKDDFQQLAASVPSFAVALLKEKFRSDDGGQAEKPVAEHWQHDVYSCPIYGCGMEFAADLTPQLLGVSCPGCGNVMSAAGWSRFLRAPSDA